MKPTIEQIVKHPAVSRCMAPLADGDPRIAEWRTPGLVKIERLRKARRDNMRAHANARDEADPGGWPNNGSGAGVVDLGGGVPGDRLLREALKVGGLPSDLRRMIEEYLT